MYDPVIPGDTRTWTMVEGEEEAVMAPSALDKLSFLNLPGVEKKDTTRDYKREYREYQGRPSQIKRRAERNAARAKLGPEGQGSHGGRPQEPP